LTSDVAIHFLARPKKYPPKSSALTWPRPSRATQAEAARRGIEWIRASPRASESLSQLIDSIEGGIGNIRSVISLSSAEGLRSSI
jgi:hypothetical protein